MSYYFIAIGGSGAKVLESIAHLAAAGMFPASESRATERIFIMAVDPDVGNGNLARTGKALRCYEACQNLSVGQTELFKTKVRLADPFVWNPTEHDKCLDDVLNYQFYRTQPIGDLYSLLYTKPERMTLLNEGFRGHPAIGAAVMAKKVAIDDGGEMDLEDKSWREFNRFVEEDVGSGSTAKIFLAGSVFGGTGAAGMPTIAQLLRHTFKEHCDAGKVIIGGALVLPFFTFVKQADAARQDEMAASSKNFLTNTQAALNYYYVKNKYEDVYDTMYFIGDSRPVAVKKYSIGAAEQKNDAHLVDFYAALSALDFYASSKADLKKYSYICHAAPATFTWSDFPQLSYIEEGGKAEPLRERLGNFIRFIMAYRHLVRPIVEARNSGDFKPYQYPWYIDNLADLALEEPDVEGFHGYTDSFVRWIRQITEKGSPSPANNVNLINPLLMDNRDETKIKPEVFDKAIVDEPSDITINEIWTRLCENALDDDEAEGFGRFLRLLYDSCKNV